ncbi:MAG: ribonuclease PH [candidate division WOR-3 bacterium]|nr:ribonuclease PH [candidate division WOR-3 bacterium]MDH5683633.1 ribonuclease PH [candidate division WOR-3 bacterium]
MLTRLDGRASDQIREIKIELGCLKFAEGSCLINAGDTRILCAATFERRVPPFLVGSGQGWITAEYNLLPRSTKERTIRESTTGRVKGRNQEIQRFLGRSLRAVCDLYALGENQIIVDCDVLQADGGTRTISLTGGFCALAQAVKNLLDKKLLEKNPIVENVAATSVGIVDGQILLDLVYEEDSKADTDMNLVMTESGRIVEIQATAERIPFTLDDYMQMFNLARQAIEKIIQTQRSSCLAYKLK